MTRTHITHQHAGEHSELDRSRNAKRSGRTTKKPKIEVYVTPDEKLLVEAASIYREMSQSEFVRFAIKAEIERMKVYERLREELNSLPKS